jgi:hypothetical protein
MRINIKELPYYEGIVSLEGSTYRIIIKWMEHEYSSGVGKWYMDLIGVVNDIEIRGIALLVGRDLLEPYGYGITFGRLEVVDNSEANEDPEYEGMGDRWTLEYSELVS